MTIEKHLNVGYSDGVPLALGDRYYSQDLIRDHWFQQDRLGQFISDIGEGVPMILYGGEVTQGTGDTLNITPCVGYHKLSVKIPDTFASIPPTVMDADVEAVRVKSTLQTNLVIPSAVLDGTTPNYVKLAYSESAGNVRTRAKKVGDYSYEMIPSFTITVNETPPTAYEICLRVFTGSAGGTFVFTNVLPKVFASVILTNCKTYDMLLVKRNTGTPASKIDISWTELYLGWMKTGPQSFTLNIETSGLLGLDTGSESANSWYYIFIIAKTDGTVSAILSASSTDPTMPAGYTLRRLVSMVKNESGNFVDFIQVNKNYKYIPGGLITARTNFFTIENLALAYVPDLVHNVDIQINASIAHATAMGFTITAYGYNSSLYATLPEFKCVEYSPSGFCFGEIHGTLRTTNKTIRILFEQLTGGATTITYELYTTGFEVPL